MNISSVNPFASAASFGSMGSSQSLSAPASGGSLSTNGSLLSSQAQAAQGEMGALNLLIDNSIKRTFSVFA